MQDENTGGKRDYPTESGTAGRTDGRDASPEQTLAVENPPREGATVRTRGCSGADPRPVAQSTPRDENPCDGTEILEPGREGGDPREESQLLEQLHVANQFDEAEADDPAPLTLESGRVYGHRLLIEGEEPGEWVRATNAVAVGDRR